MIYCDTSFIFSLYVEDSGSQAASEQMTRVSEPLVWTAWHQLEFTTSLEARVGRKANTRKEAAAVQSTLNAHLDKNGIFSRRTSDWEQALARSVELSLKWGASIGCRSLDVLHVSICLGLGIENFWSADDRQRKLAKAVGLKINQLPSP
jgi:predicted nucleic acid-binding protein